jgi:hypothetical protein
MSYWKDKIDFWRNKTAGNQIYKRQKQEIASDLRTLIEALDITTIIDVGGYKGELGKLLPKNVKYINLDISEGFDVTYDWTHQLIEKNIVLDDWEHTLALTSLFFIVIPPPAVEHVLTQMRKYSKTQYYFEEDADDILEGQNSKQISEEYGGKWAYNWTSIIGDVDYLFSKVNKKWVRIFSR